MTKLICVKAFLNITTNPAWEIARQLPPQLLGQHEETINIRVPSDPTPAAYHKILEEIPRLITTHRPDVIVHIGLDLDSKPGVFRVERSAPKEGYHDIPDTNRKVFTRAENKKIFGKSSTSLITSLDIDTAVKTWQAACSSITVSPADKSAHVQGSKLGSKNKKQRVSVQVGDDVGTYVCGFQYYSSMLEMQKQSGKRPVVFLHVPKLDTNEQVQIGVEVTQELIRALVSVLE